MIGHVDGPLIGVILVSILLAGCALPSPSVQEDEPIVTQTASVCDEQSTVPAEGQPRRLPDWQPPANGTPARGGFLYLDSDTTDFVGEGQKLIYKQSCLDFTISQYDRILRFVINGEIGWDIQVQHDTDATRLETGTYPNVTSPHHGAGAGIEVHSHHSCGGSDLRATFIVDEVRYDPYGVPTMLTLRFEQHCGGAAAALLGKLHWVA